MRILNFLKHLLLNNKGKIILLLISLSGFLSLKVLDFQPFVYDTVMTFQQDEKYYSVYQDDDEFLVAEVESPTSCEVIKHNSYEVWIFVLSIIVAIFGTGIFFDEDSEFKWDKKWCWTLANYDAVNTYYDESNGGTTYYTLDGRLLTRVINDGKLSRGGLLNIVEDYIESKNAFPLYEGPRYVRRDNRLKDILKN